MYKSISYFSGLNALRFFAASLVVVHHAETIRIKNGLTHLKGMSFFENGGTAVTFFFVLSGFLITYLLLKEKTITHAVSIKHFYIKRMLRIWPLYFLLFIIGTLIMPVLFNVLHINYVFPYTFLQSWYLFVFFLPGLATFYYGTYILDPLWSIGVEELFYLIWAPLFKFIKRKILLVLFGIIALKVVLLLLVSFEIINNSLFAYLISTFQFEAMAMGGLGAYFIFYRKKSLNNLFIYKIPFQILFYGFLAVYLLFRNHIDFLCWNFFFQLPVVPQLLLDSLFIYLIIGVSLIDRNMLKFKNKYLSYLGEISYGIYMYHMLVIFSLILFMKDFLLKTNILLGGALFYILLFSGVIVISAISKTWYENKFLALKEKLNDKKK
ncbi:MAG: acyltransferase [Bacteroidales bacterium]|nr:acyltransferase [Bacteroidales bacterium]